MTWTLACRCVAVFGISILRRLSASNTRHDINQIERLYKLNRRHAFFELKSVTFDHDNVTAVMLGEMNSVAEVGQQSFHGYVAELKRKRQIRLLLN